MDKSNNGMLTAIDFVHSTFGYENRDWFVSYLNYSVVDGVAEHSIKFSQQCAGECIPDDND